MAIHDHEEVQDESALNFLLLREWFRTVRTAWKECEDYGQRVRTMSALQLSLPADTSLVVPTKSFARLLVYKEDY